MVNIMQSASNALKSVRESADRLPSADEIKNNALSTISAARERIVGSGQITTELSSVKDTAVDLVATGVSTPLKTIGKLLTLQPVEATRTLFEGLKRAAGDVGAFVVSPVALTHAAVRSSLRGVKGAASAAVNLPKDAVLKGYNVVSNGLDKVFNLFGSDEAAKSKAPDLGAQSAPPPSAPTAV